MKLVARTLLVTMAAGTLFVGPTAMAFAVSEPSVPAPGGGAPVDAQQVEELLDEAEGNVSEVIKQVTGGAPGYVGDEQSLSGAAAPTDAAVPVQGPEVLCPVFDQIDPRLGEECRNAIGGGGGDDDNGDKPPLDDIFDQFPPELYAAIHDLICAIDENLPDEIKVQNITRQILENEQLQPLAEQVPTQVRKALLDPCAAEERTPPPTPEDQPRPVTDATLPKTGGAPLWLIPMGLFLVALGSKLVWPRAD